MSSMPKRWLLVAVLAVVALAAVTCDSGHRFTIINETDGDVVYSWDGVPEGKLGLGMQQEPGLLYKYGDGGLPERHLFQAFDTAGNLICESNRTEEQFRLQNWTIRIIEVSECGEPSRGAQ
jgi:hypothetical protein